MAREENNATATEEATANAEEGSEVKVDLTDEQKAELSLHGLPFTQEAIDRLNSMDNNAKRQSQVKAVTQRMIGDFATKGYATMILVEESADDAKKAKKSALSKGNTTTPAGQGIASVDIPAIVKAAAKKAREKIASLDAELAEVENLPASFNGANLPKAYADAIGGQQASDFWSALLGIRITTKGDLRNALLIAGATKK